MECVVIGVWAFCALIGTVICQEKGRSAIEGLFLGLLFGPIGIIVCAVLSRDEPALEERALRSGEMRKCPHCAEAIRREATVCRYCGRDVSATKASEVVSAEDRLPLHTCPNCGAAYDLDKTPTCPQYGSGDPNAAEAVPAQQSRTPAAAGPTAAEELLSRAITAAQTGRQSEGRELLRQLVRQDKDNEKAWLWLSGTVDTLEEREECLRRVLSINPNNVHAQRGLRALAESKPPPAKMSRGRWTVLAALGTAALVVLICLAYLSIKTFQIQPLARSSSTQLPDSEPAVEPAPTATATAESDDSDSIYLLCLEDMQSEITRLYDDINSTYAQASDHPESTATCGPQSEWATTVSRLKAEHTACPVPAGQLGQSIRDATDGQLEEMAEAIQCWRAHCESPNAQWRHQWLEQGHTRLDQAAAHSATVKRLVQQLQTPAQ
jgi:hypothetical protein